MNTRKNIVIFFFITYISTMPCFANKYGAEFLTIGAGAKASALGGAAAANTADATGTYWNPAAISQVNRYAIALMYSPLFDGLEAYHFVSAVTTFHRLGTFGLSWIRLGIADIPIYPPLEGTHEERLSSRLHQPLPHPEGYLQDIENAWFISYATVPQELRSLNFPNQMSFGGSIKYIRQQLGSARGSGLGGDIALLLRMQHPVGRMAVGVVLQNALGSSVRWTTGHEDRITSNLKIGLAYTPAMKILSDFTLVSDLDIFYTLTPHVGIEYRFLNLLGLRAGLDNMNATLGAGLRIGGLTVDYAFTSYDLANAHRVSLHAAFD